MVVLRNRLIFCLLRSSLTPVLLLRRNFLLLLLQTLAHPLLLPFLLL